MVEQTSSKKTDRPEASDEVSEKTMSPPPPAKKNSVDLPIFFGQKAGMTRIFDDNGNHVPVTVIKRIPNMISQVKTKEKDGYDAYQVAYYEKREKLINNPTKGHLKKAGLSNYFRFFEVKMDQVSVEALGSEVSLGEFKPDSFVDVTATSKGKGFQGVMKRYGFAGGPAAHGSHFHRAPGAIGNRATPGRVFKRKKMPGHMGSTTQTIQNLKLIEINKNGYLLVSGAIPGGENGFVKIAKATKKKG
ncbi:MAG: 50S ribosomal protein L3 [Halobacteriovoraceae bacterium]|nr:50S ribosomal protein L3 [Halobacteriovoraceae bacterium]